MNYKLIKKFGFVVGKQSKNSQSKPKNVENTEPERCICEFCGKDYNCFNAVINHMKGKHCLVKRKFGYICYLCGQRFKEMDDIQNHVGK